MNNVFNSPLAWLTLWAFLAIVFKPLESLLRESGSLLHTLFGEFRKGSRGAADNVRNGSSKARKINHDAIQAVKALLRMIIRGLGTITNTLNAHARHVSNILAPKGHNLAWRIVGSMVIFGMLPLFIYADIAQGLNSLSTLLPGQVEIPEFLQELPIPIAISSVGSMLVLGMIMGDLLNLTDFVPWANLKGKKRTLLFVVVLLTLVMALGFSVLLSLNRWPHLYPPLPPVLAERLHSLASLSQSLVLIPLLITTLLLVRSFTGFFVIYLLAVTSLSLPIQLVRFLFKLLEKAIALGGLSSETVIRILFALVGGVLTSLSWVFGVADALAGRLTLIIEGILGVVVAPWQSLGQRIDIFTKKVDDRRIARFSHSEDVPHNSENGNTGELINPESYSRDGGIHLDQATNERERVPS